MNRTRFWAIFFSILVISIPINTAIIFASVYPSPASGKDKVPNFARDNDVINFTAEVYEGPGVVVNATDVMLSISGIDKPAAKCDLIGTVYVCDFSFNAYATSNNFYEYSVYHVPTGDTSNGNVIYLDKEKPALSLASKINGTVTSADEIEVHIDVQDGYSYTDKCSGLSDVKIYEFGLGKSNPLYVGSALPLDCSLYSQDISLDILSLTSGPKRICAVATDRLGNINDLSGSSCINFSIDRTSPLVLEAKFYDINDKNVLYLTPQLESLDLKVKIKSDGSDLIFASVYLGDLNPYVSAPVELSCEKSVDPNVYMCSATVPVMASESKSYSLKFSGYDAAGNHFEEMKSVSFTVDSEEPKAGKISTDILDNNGTSYLRLGKNKVTGTFFDDRGIDSVYLLTSNVNEGIKGACTSGTSVTCTWDYVLSQDSEFTSLNFLILDVAKHQSTYGQIFQMDITHPRIVNSTISFLDAKTYFDDRIYIMSGDSFQLTLYIYDSISGLKNPSGSFASNVKLNEELVFSPSKNNVSANSCTLNGTNLWKCVWDLKGVHETAKLGFDTNICDVSGNCVEDDSKKIESFYIQYVDKDGVRKMSDKMSLPIYAAEDTVHDFWNVSVSSFSPKAVDREIAANRDKYPLYYTLSVTPNPGYEDAQVMFFRFKDPKCLDFTNSTDFKDYFNRDPRLIIVGNNSHSPIVVFKMKTGELKNKSDNISFNCQFEITTLYKGKIKNGEVDNSTINVFMYNSNLGNPQDKVAKEIKDAKSSFLLQGGVYKVIDLLDKMLVYAKIMCGIYKTFIATIKATSSLISLFAVCSANPVTGETCVSTQSALQNFRGKLETFAGEAEGQDKKTSKGKLFGMMNRMCKLTSCKEPLDYEFVKDWNEAGNDIAKTGLLGSDGTNLYADPSENMFAAVLSFCLPGVIYNLKKFQQIQCYRIDCIQKSALVGASISKCDTQYSYQLCTWVFGQVWDALPTKVLTDIMNKFFGLLNNPVALGFFVADKACSANCQTKGISASGCGVCNALSTAQMWQGVMCDLGLSSGCTPVWDKYTIKHDICKDVLKN